MDATCHETTKCLTTERNIYADDIVYADATVLKNRTRKKFKPPFKIFRVLFSKSEIF